MLKRAPWVPLIIMLVVVIATIFAPWFAPFPPNEGDLNLRLLAPLSTVDGNTYILGTDTLGRDILSRIIYGARVPMGVALLSVAGAGVIGAVLGILAAYIGGVTDSVISRVADMMMGLPVILIALVLVISMGPSLQNVILVIMLTLWSHYARQARGETLSIKERPFIALARVAGCSHYRIIRRHVFPNIVNSLIVLATLEIGYVIVLEATLGFLGVGVPPRIPSWGSMVSEGRALIASAWWVSFFPGVAISVTVLSFNLFGDWLRDTLDPKLRHL